ncbi:hypothetical protein ACFV1X_37435 [Streptomyces coelicoflavus]|uniref:hypothetical protein n=1 Tax=Streptomyces coelicoflavus TaxID=285562 RepID=UPI003676B91B
MSRLDVFALNLSESLNVWRPRMKDVTGWVLSCGTKTPVLVAATDIATGMYPQSSPPAAVRKVVTLKRRNRRKRKDRADETRHYG